MFFYSTRNKDIKMNFQEAEFKGLSEDGGLFVPDFKPDFYDLFNSFDDKTSFIKIASETTAAFLADELTPAEAELICRRAFDFKPKFHQIEENLQVLELFHGPSCAFKDYGASFLAASMEFFLKNNNRKAVILTATSGDTGSAVAQAFLGKENIDVVILYPSGRVSPLQEKQLTTLGQNIHALEVEGSFDDCQKMVKEAFLDKKLNSAITLTSANSINLGRLFPQSFYYIWAWAQMKETSGKIKFCIPSGNFGNLTAGVYASIWGMKCEPFLAATNANDVVPEFLEKSIYNPRPSVTTYSNAMDVGAPSNFERLQNLFPEIEDFRRIISGISISDEDTLETMKTIYDNKNYLLCPHTAVGVKAAQQWQNKNGHAESMIVLGTAHPGKFVEVVEEATGQKPELPPALKALENKTKQAELIKPQLRELSDFLTKNFHDLSI